MSLWRRVWFLWSHLFCIKLGVSFFTQKSLVISPTPSHFCIKTFTFEISYDFNLPNHECGQTVPFRWWVGVPGCSQAGCVHTFCLSLPLYPLTLNSLTQEFSHYSMVYGIFFRLFSFFQLLFLHFQTVTFYQEFSRLLA